MALTPAQQITQLYVGYFHRAPDPEGLNYWIGRLTATNDALSFQQIAQSFSEQPEAHALYPFLAYPNFLGSDVESFINEVYQNLFNRAPDAAGKAYWANELLSGNVTTGEFIAAVTGGAQNSAAGQDLTIVTNKTTVAEYYATEVASSNVAWSLETAKAALEGVNATDASVAAAKLNIDAFVDTGYWPGTEPGPEDAHQGTAGNVDLTAGQALVAQADAATPTLNTYVSGTVNGTGDNEATFTLNGDITAQVTLNDIPVVTVKAGPNNTSVTAKGWNGTERLNIVQPSANIAITDIQSSSTYVNIVDANRGADQKIELTYDAQGVVASDSTANIGVRETFGQVILGVDGLGTTSIDTINLDINDVAGHDSTLEALRGVNTKTLDIAGGYEGGKFKITQALDKTLTTLDASEVVSDLDLNISDAARKAINAKLGQGDDVLRTGNTLDDNDVIDGGEGDDVLTAVFTDAGTRKPTLTNIETLDLTFNANAAVNFRNVDDVETIKIRESATGDRFDLTELDSTFTNLEVEGKQGNAYHVVEYARGETDTNLNVTWENNSGNNGKLGWLNAILEPLTSLEGLNKLLLQATELVNNSSNNINDIESAVSYILNNQVNNTLQGGITPELLANLWYTDTAGALGVKNAETFSFEHKGEYNTWFQSKDPLVTNDAWQFDINGEAITEVLKVKNTGFGDLELKSGNLLAFGETYEKVLDLIEEISGIVAAAGAGSTQTPVYASLAQTTGLEAFQGSPELLVRLAINNLYAGLGNIGGTNNVRELSFETEAAGDIKLNDVRNVAELETLDIIANVGDIKINSVGFGSGLGANNPPSFDAARDLEDATLIARNGATVELNLLNALGDLSSPYIANGASIDNLKLQAEAGSRVILDAVAAGDIGNTVIDIGNQASVRVNTWLLANNTNSGTSGGKLVATGAGTLEEDGDGGYFVFLNQAIKSQDYSGLTTDTVHVSFVNDNGGVTFVGTNNNAEAFKVAGTTAVNPIKLSLPSYDVADDYNGDFYGISVTGDAVLGGNGNDTFKVGGGNDFVFTGAGKQNIVDLGTGNDILVIAKGAAVTATLGAGSDTVYVNGTNAGNITDFNLNADTLKLDISNITDTLSSNGISFKLVNGDGVAIDGANYPLPQFQTVNGAAELSSATTVINLVGNFGSATDVQTAIQTGSHQITTANELDNPWDGSDTTSSALLLSWIDTNGNQHLSAARITDSQQDATNNKWSYNFDVVDLIGLDATNSHLNTGNLSFVA